MLRDITIGRYYPADSPVHRMDARAKMLCVTMFVAALFMLKGFSGYAAAAVFVAGAILLSRAPFGYVMRGLKSIFFLIIFTTALNAVFTKGDTVLLRLWGLNITLEGLLLSLRLSLRLVLLICSTTLLTLTTTPVELCDAIEYILKPFAKIGLPAHEISMMMTIALRFIPTLLDEADKIIKAQTARGADFDTGGVVKRAKAMLPLLIPLFISAFRRADELATAMEARCYRGGQGRTKMNVMRMRRADWAIALCVAAAACGMFALNLTGI